MIDYSLRMAIEIDEVIEKILAKKYMEIQLEMIEEIIAFADSCEDDEGNTGNYSKDDYESALALNAEYESDWDRDETYIETLTNFRKFTEDEYGIELGEEYNIINDSASWDMIQYYPNHYSQVIIEQFNLGH